MILFTIARGRPRGGAGIVRQMPYLFPQLSPGGGGGWGISLIGALYGPCTRLSHCIKSLSMKAKETAGWNTADGVAHLSELPADLKWGCGPQESPELYLSV